MTIRQFKRRKGLTNGFGSTKRFTQRVNDVFDRLAAYREPQQFRVKPAGVKDSAPTFTGHKIVMGQINEGANQRGFNAKTRALRET